MYCLTETFCFDQKACDSISSVQRYKYSAFNNRCNYKIAFVCRSPSLMIEPVARTFIKL